MLSYAQNGEDVVLARAFDGQQLGFYIDIGACHPVEDSVTLHFYERGWHGLNVEPDRELHEVLLKARPRDVNLCAAVGRTRGQVAYHPTGTRGHGTLDAALASDRSTGRPVERVPTMPLSDVIDCYGSNGGEIDFLKIDVEAWEAEVIASADWTRHRPRVLVIEAVDDKGLATHDAWEPSLLGAGYQFALFDGLNRFYSRHEDAGLLLPRLVAPANVRDGWRRADDVRAHESTARLQIEAASAVRLALEAEDRSNALGLDLEEARASERAAAAHAQAALLEVDRLAVDASRARAEAAAALRREEAAEASMASLEMDLVRRDAELVRRDAELVRRDAEIAAAQTRASALEAEAAAAHARIMLDQTAMEAHVEAFGAQERALRAAHRHKAKQADDAEAWLAAVRTSTSWRVTRPFRVGTRLLMGIRGRR